MKKKRFSVEQMIGMLKQAQVGVPVVEVNEASIAREKGLEPLAAYLWAQEPAENSLGVMPAGS